jgi:Zn finger protein HypA/HybF involved in hydrogenase expression
MFVLLVTTIACDRPWLAIPRAHMDKCLECATEVLNAVIAPLCPKCGVTVIDWIYF